MRFRDRGEAGDVLADRLQKAGLDSQNTVVIGIPRGGIILADIVAGRLGAAFDIVIPRKLSAPGSEELAIGAVMADGTSYVNDYVVDALKISAENIESEKVKQAAEISRRMALYRRKELGYDISGRDVVLVDDGAATGSTMTAAARWIAKQSPKSLTVAVPVAPKATVEMLALEADSVIVAATPRDFSSVGQFYDEFDQITDEQVIQIAKSRKLV